MRWLKIVLVPAKHLDCALIGRPPAVVSDPKFTLDKSMSRGKCVCIWIQAQFFFFCLQAVSWLIGYDTAFTI